MKQVLALVTGACCLLSTVAIAESANPLSAETLVSYPGKTLTVVIHKAPNFIAVTSGRNGTGLGAISPTLEGNKLVRQDQIPDPSLTVAAKLAPMVQAKSGATNIATREDVGPLATGDVAKLVNGKGLILEVWTYLWAFQHLPLDFDHYIVKYEANARILDPAGNPIAGARCLSAPEDKVSFEQLTADHAAGLKALLIKAASTCTDAMAKVLLGTPASAQGNADTKDTQ